MGEREFITRILPRTLNSNEWRNSERKEQDKRGNYPKSDIFRYFKIAAIYKVDGEGGTERDKTRHRAIIETMKKD